MTEINPQGSDRTGRLGPVVGGRMRPQRGTVVLPNPQDALDADGNFDSGRWQRFKAGTLSSVSKGTKETVQFAGRHRKSSVFMAVAATVGLGAGYFAAFGPPEPIDNSYDFVLDIPGHVTDVSFQSPVEFSRGEKNPETAPEQQTVPATLIIPEPAPETSKTPAVPAPQPAQEQEVTTSRLSGSFTPEQATKVIDVVGDEIQDNKVIIKIVKAEGYSWSTFDWSQAKAFEGIGIKNFDPSNPVLNGAERWQITTILAKSLGVTPQQLNLVYYGDEFKIPITMELVDKFKSLNVEVPDSVLRQAGLLSLAKEDEEEGGNNATILNSTEVPPVKNVEAAGLVTVSEKVNDAKPEKVSTAEAAALNLVRLDKYNIDDVETVDGVGILTLQDGTKVMVSGEVAQAAQRIAGDNRIPAIVKSETKGGYYYKLKDLENGFERNLKWDQQERIFRFAAFQKQEKDEEEAWYAVWDFINAKNAPFLAAGIMGIAGFLAVMYKVLGAMGYDKNSFWFRRLRKIDDDDDEEASREARLAKVKADRLARKASEAIS